MIATNSYLKQQKPINHHYVCVVVSVHFRMAGLDKYNISPTAVTPTEVIWNADGKKEPPSRKTSTKSNLYGLDNPTFESPRCRKISSTSTHEEIGPVRKKSCLHNANYVTDTISNGKLNT